MSNKTVLVFRAAVKTLQGKLLCRLNNRNISLDREMVIKICLPINMCFFYIWLYTQVDSSLIHFKISTIHCI